MYQSLFFDTFTEEGTFNFSVMNCLILIIHYLLRLFVIMNLKCGIILSDNSAAQIERA